MATYLRLRPWMATPCIFRIGEAISSLSIEIKDGSCGRAKSPMCYNSIGFFAPDPRYAADVANSLREFTEMVARFHDAGLEVILDVVYNHTAEGNKRGPTLSFKGIDTASYYRPLPDQKRYYINDTGTGNTLNLSHARAMQMVIDSVRYWVQEMHVDGFRFDLGTILAREPNEVDNQSGFLKACSQVSPACRPKFKCRLPKLLISPRGGHS